MSEQENYYVTTAIWYTNGSPHVGHAYEGITADCIARYHRIYGRNVRFQTGSDEHGQKIANSAEDKGMKPKELCDQYVAEFKKLMSITDVSEDVYLRTTEPRHHEKCKWLFNKCKENGDIYLGNYDGWYNVKEEAFVTQLEAEMNDFKDPSSGIPLTKMSESSYFFKMSKYQDRLVQYIKDNPEFIQPDQKRHEILKRLEEELRDLSSSRTTFNWGIPVPNDEEHVMYVWFDALTNYLTGIDYPDGPDAHLWPADVHIIGKDIIWFHTVIWPCMLMSAEIPLPKTIFSHGFVNDALGKKMSKSVGNVIDPTVQIEKYGSDSFRLYLILGSVHGSDMPYSEESLVMMHNADLANTLGNLVHRGISLCQGKVPDAVPEIVFDLEKLRTEVDSHMKKFALEQAGQAIMGACRDTNKYLTVNEPWKIKDDPERKAIIIRSAVEAIYIIAHFISPLIPKGADAIFKKLDTPPSTLCNLNANFVNLVSGHAVNAKGILYPKVLTSDEIAAEAAKKKAAAEAAKKKKNKGNQAVNQDIFTMIDIRVGCIKKAWPHPDSDKLICEEIDVGEETGLRPIASGLRAHYNPEDISEQKVLVIANLKPIKLAGFQSCGMVLCAKTADGTKIEFVEPPAGAKVGERIMVEGLEGEPLSGAQIQRKKIWDQVQKLLTTNDDKVACYNGKPFVTSAGPCTAPTLPNAILS